MSKYKITGIVLVDLGSIETGQHIPYFLCAEVTGPKGGTYVLDEVCTEHLLKRATKDAYVKFKPVFTEAVFQGKLKRSTVSFKGSSDEGVKQYASQVKATPLIRKDGIETVKKMAENLDMSFMSK